MYDIVELEKRGIPCVEIVTKAFEQEAIHRAAGMGLVSLSCAVIPTEVSYLKNLSMVQAIADEAMIGLKMYFVKSIFNVFLKSL